MIKTSIILNILLVICHPLFSVTDLPVDDDQPVFGNTDFPLDYIAELVQHNTDSALLVLTDLEKEAALRDNRETLSTVYTLMARAYYFKGNYYLGIEYGEKAADLHYDTNNPEAYHQILIQLGSLNIHHGNLFLAKDYMMRALRYFEEERDTLNMLWSYINISGIHILLDNPDIGHRYVMKAIEFSNAVASDYALTKALNNAGILLYMQGKSVEAKETFHRAVELAVSSNESQSYLDCLNYLGIIEMQNGNYQVALDYYKQMMDFSGNYVDRFVLSNGMINKGMVHEKLDNLPEAILWTQKSIDLSTLSGDHGNLRDANRQMALYMKKTGKNDEAFEYMEKYITLNDSLLKITKDRNILEMEAIYDSEQKEQQIRYLEFQNIIKEERISTITNVSLLAGSLLLVSTLFVLLLIRHKQRKNQLLTLELEHQLLRSQMNPHFIFNSLTAVQNYVLKADSMTAATFLAKLTRLMRLILMNSREKLISLDNELKTIKNYLEIQTLRFPDRFSYTLKVSPDLNHEEIMIPPMLAQPFIENSIEHGFPASDRDNKIEISYSKDSINTINIQVEDNGIGRARSQESHDRSHQSLSTEITLKRITALKKMGYHDADFNIEDKTGPSGTSKGTKVIFCLPVIYKSI
ncbi:MAG: tetratricopeptide repeat protein [Bacteroidales bacterium]